MNRSRMARWSGQQRRRGVEEPGGDGVSGSGGAVVDAELGEDTRDMMLNRAHTDEEGSGDGRVGLPRDEQPQDVIFTWGQRYALGAGGWLERGERLSDCLRRGKRPASGPRGRERFFT